MLDFLNNAPVPKRGEVYSYHNVSGYRGYCVIISANFRSHDKYVSAISLTNADKDTSRHGDDVRFCFSDNRQFCCHCGMITYIRRDRLDYKVCALSKSTMRMIDDGIKKELGLEKPSNVSSDPEDLDYKKLYERFIAQIGKVDNGE